MNPLSLVLSHLSDLLFGWKSQFSGLKVHFLRSLGNVWLKMLKALTKVLGLRLGIVFNGYGFFRLCQVRKIRFFWVVWREIGFHFCKLIYRSLFWDEAAISFILMQVNLVNSINLNFVIWSPKNDSFLFKQSFLLLNAAFNLMKRPTVLGLHFFFPTFCYFHLHYLLFLSHMIKILFDFLNNSLSFVFWQLFFVK